MGRPVIWRHPSSREHDTGAHPERIERIVAIEHALESRDWLGWRVRDSPVVSSEALHAVHPAGYVAALEALCSSGGGAIDLDTIVSEGSLRAALHAAGGAQALVDELLGAGARTGASLHRPPGHHATTDRAMGFCLLNNVAVAARRALDRWDAGRVMVLDWDVHHGNGTNDIFHSEPGVLFVSIHESPLYPGTGPERDVGSGAGVGYTVNLPVPSGSGDGVFGSLVEHVAVPLARAYEPALLLISAGYDAHELDPLAGCRVTTAGYAGMAASVRRVAEELEIPVGLVLEGGYELEALTEALLATLAVLGADEAPAPPERDVHPLARRAGERLAERWPAVGAR
ncbi:MAG: histone deacetylase family protein [Solirubrobacteraceae bacterium]